mgnify:CR=1 FL=1
MANKKKKVAKEEKRAFRFSKLIVLLVIMLNVFFTMGTLYVFYKVGNEPTVLIGSFFAFTTTELWSLALLKMKGE